MADFDNAPVPMRQAVKFATGLKLHQACGAFLHYLREYEKMAPAADVLQSRQELFQVFIRGFMDPDLHHSLEQTVPPGRLEDISTFRCLHGKNMRLC